MTSAELMNNPRCIIVRAAVLPEDEGFPCLLHDMPGTAHMAGEQPLEKAIEWIKEQESEYFKPADYYVAVPLVYLEKLKGVKQ